MGLVNTLFLPMTPDRLDGLCSFYFLGGIFVYAVNLNTFLCFSAIQGDVNQRRS